MDIKIDELKTLVERALEKYGYTGEETAVIRDVLMYAQMRGNNQGIVKLIGKGIPKRPEGKPPIVVKETPVSLLLDGQKTHAMVVMNQLAESAIAKAKVSGVGIAGNFNTKESTGALGFYAKKIADAGLIGIVFSSSPFQTTAPYGSTDARFCTNPMAYGIPTGHDPVVLDMSTSAMAYYGLIEAKTVGRKVPADIGYDKTGNPTQDPAEIMDGALKTFGGYKGSGLALVVQLLAGALVRAESFNSDSDNAGNLMLAVNPEILTTKEDFVKEVASVIQRLKTAKKAPGVNEIMMPGERGNAMAQERVKSGNIEIEDNLLSELQKVAE